MAMSAGAEAPAFYLAGNTAVRDAGREKKQM
jgi:hypothetical protein